VRASSPSQAASRPSPTHATQHHIPRACRAHVAPCPAVPVPPVISVFIQPSPPFPHVQTPRRLQNRNCQPSPRPRPTATNPSLFFSRSSTPHPTPFLSFVLCVASSSEKHLFKQLRATFGEKLSLGTRGQRYHLRRRSSPVPKQRHGSRTTRCIPFSFLIATCAHGIHRSNPILEAWGSLPCFFRRPRVVSVKRNGKKTSMGPAPQMPLLSDSQLSRMSEPLPARLPFPPMRGQAPPMVVGRRLAAHGAPLHVRKV
jgi:hypothetical protein